MDIPPAAKITTAHVFQRFVVFFYPSGSLSPPSDCVSSPAIALGNGTSLEHVVRSR